MTLPEVPASTETEAAAWIGAAAAEPATLEPSTVYLVADGPGKTRVVTTDEYGAAPRRARGYRKVSDAESFVRYINRHRRAGTEVYAHVNSSSIVGIINAHEGTDTDFASPGWGDHLLSLELEHSKEWIAWNERDLGQHKNVWFDQVEFAEFINDRALDVHEPDHATLIELALTFEAASRADFQSSQRLDDGSVKFAYTDTVAAKAGQKGDITIPKELKLALRPYIGGPRVWVLADFRYRLNGGNLKLGFALIRPENVLETAFADIVTEIQEGKKVTPAGETEPVQTHHGIGDVPLFYGKPA